MSGDPKILNVTGVRAPTPSQIREHASDVGAVYIRIERRGSFEEMSLFNPELLLHEPASIRQTLMGEIERKLLAVIREGAKS